MTTQTNAAVAALEAEHGKTSDHDIGQCFISDQHVCQSNAGYYIGRWCIEAIGLTWLPQPWSRDSEYFETEGEAQVLLDNWRINDG